MTGFVSQQTVFFVDDDAELRAANTQSLDLAGLDVRAFADAASALAEIDAGFAGVLVSDIRMPRIDGLQLFARVRAIDPEIPVILITGHADVAMAVSALRDGAFDFLPKPFATDHLIAATRRALETRRLVLDNRRLRAAAAEVDSPLIGDSAAMVRLRETIAQVARAEVDVLLEGETGTGKELVAAMLHRQSPRAPRPFVAVNCAALPEAFAETELFGHTADAVPNVRLARTGRIEASSRGTLFLDEIDGMPHALQSRLLRVLEEREVLPLGADRPVPLDLRVIAASKRDLSAMGADEFRRDLYFRLNVVRLSIPPLRERRADIAQLFAHFVAEASAQAGQGEFRMDDAVRRHLLEHDWPGNVRELRNFAYSAVLDIQKPAVPIAANDLSLADRVGQYEEALIRETLEVAGGSVTRAMAMLRVPRKTLYDKFRRFGVVPEAYRRRR